MRSLHTILAAVVFVFTAAAAQAFETTVSTAYTVPNALVLNLTNSSMNTAWFVQRTGGRTVYSTDATVGALVHGTGNIQAHATWVINYTASTHTVNLNSGRTHITNWWGNQRCNVYENGTCECHNNPNWNICAIPQMAIYVTSLVALAVAARINA